MTIEPIKVGLELQTDDHKGAIEGWMNVLVREDGVSVVLLAPEWNLRVYLTADNALEVAKLLAVGGRQAMMEEVQAGA